MSSTEKLWITDDFWVGRVNFFKGVAPDHWPCSYGCPTQIVGPWLITTQVSETRKIGVGLGWAKGRSPGKHDQNNIIKNS